MKPGAAAVGEGSVFHRRSRPTTHEFTQSISYVWLDPDRPGDLCARHPLWSSTRPAPARFRRRDYGLSASGSLADAVRDGLAPVLGHRPTGPIRMLTQVRRWGWLFNPITIYVAWDDPDGDPVGAVLEVTNTPWKERVHYPVPLRSGGDGSDWWVAETDKRLHVSPFLDEEFRYDIRLRNRVGRLDLQIDVYPTGAHPPAEPMLRTGVTIDLVPAGRAALGRSLWRSFAPTHRVSWGIHRQALALWLKRVPFVTHPAKRAASSDDRGPDGRSTGHLDAPGGDEPSDQERPDRERSGHGTVSAHGSARGEVSVS